jgi:rubrerythrin
MGLNDRLRRLENRTEAKRCPECRLPPDDPGYIVIQDGKESRQQEWCPECGRPKFFIIEVVEEDGGAENPPEAATWP